MGPESGVKHNTRTCSVLIISGTPCVQMLADRMHVLEVSAKLLFILVNVVKVRYAASLQTTPASF